jgi:hypothetical protein
MERKQNGKPWIYIYIYIMCIYICIYMCIYNVIYNIYIYIYTRIHVYIRNGKIVPLLKALCQEGIWESGYIDPRILDLGTSCWVVSFTPRPLYPRRRTPGIHWIGGCVGPWTGLEDEKRKISPLQGLVLRPLSRPAHSQSLYRLYVDT